MIPNGLSDTVVFPVFVPSYGWKPGKPWVTNGKPGPGQAAPFMPGIVNPFSAKHAAIDIACVEHTPILAIDDGIVPKTMTVDGTERAGISYHPVYGTCAFIIHEWGLSMYAHLSRMFEPVPGEPIKRGAFIAFAARTGVPHHPCTHVHFAVEIDGFGRVDPWPLIEPSFKNEGWKEK